MPEAPSIILLCEQAKQFIGQKVLSVTGSVSTEIKEKINKCNVISVRTYGKQLLICFPDFTISVHLMLFGTYEVNSEKDSKLTLGLAFKNGELNFYASVVKLVEDPIDEVFDWRTEVMNENFDPKLALKKLKAIPETLICDALLDQKIFTGVGNKIKDEVLFREKVHPLNAIKSIPSKILKEVIEECVTYSFDMLEWKRTKTADDNLLVHYRKECPRDKSKITKKKIGKTGRTSYYCDKCQLIFK